MHNTIAQVILCSATNVAFTFLKWVRDKVVELFRNWANVVKIYHFIKQQFHFCGKTLPPLK